jgi:hypothetical protein
MSDAISAGLAAAEAKAAEREARAAERAERAERTDRSGAEQHAEHDETTATMEDNGVGFISETFDNAAAALTGRYRRQRPPPPAMSVTEARRVLQDTSCQSDAAVTQAVTVDERFRRSRPASHSLCAVCGNPNVWVERDGPDGDSVWACRVCQAHAPGSLYLSTSRPAWAWDEDQIAAAKAVRKARAAEADAEKAAAKPTPGKLRAAWAEALARLTEAKAVADAATASASDAAAACYDASDLVDTAKDARRRQDEDAPTREAISALVSRYDECWAVHSAADAAEKAAAAVVADREDWVRRRAADVLGAEDGPVWAERAAAAMAAYAGAMRGIQWLRGIGARVEAPGLPAVLKAWETKPSDWVVPGGLPDSELAAKLAALVDPGTMAPNGKGRG